jgi:cell division protein FtsZ
MGILTVGIVTKPFGFEGRKKMQSAEAGIAELKKNCDTVIEILNEKVQAVCGNMSVKQAFEQADSVLMTAAKSIAEIITGNGIVNVDFEDVKTVMQNAGSAVMGSGVHKGDNRGIRAAEAALNSPFLNNLKVQGAQKILLSVSSGEEPELGMDELTEITDFIRNQTGEDADMIWGQSVDPSLGENLRVTVIATGFEQPMEAARPFERSKVVVDIDQNHVEVDDPMNLLGIRKTEIKPEPIPVPEVVKEEIKLPPPPPPAPKVEPITMVDIDGNQLIPDPSGHAEEPLAKIPVFQSSIRDYRNTLKNLSESQRASKELPVIQQFEDQPAYLRKGKDTGIAPSSLDNNISRFQVRKDSGLSDKNSYLHDNVD